MSQSNSAAPTHPARRWLILIAKVAVAAGALAFILTRQPWSALQDAFSRLSLGALASFVAIVCGTLFMGAYRWRLLMSSYGADHLPPFSAMVRVYFVGTFYNTFIPGAVGGDVMRGVLTRESFRDGGATSAVAIVFVERALGMLAVVGIAAAATPLNRHAQIGRTLLPWFALAAVGVVTLVILIAQGRRFAAYAPLRLATVLRSLPVLERVAPFLAAVLISLLIQVVVALGAHLLIASVHPATPLTYSLLAIPIAAGAAFLPLGIAGAGPRDVTMIWLYQALGVPLAAATAAAFGFLLTILTVAAVGGVLQLVAPLKLQPAARA